VITEIPYMVNKTTLLERWASWPEKIVDGIAFVRTSRTAGHAHCGWGSKKDGFPDIILNQLYKFTQLQATFGINNLALVKMQPRVLTLKELIVYFIEHRHEVVTSGSSSMMRFRQGFEVALKERVAEDVSVVGTLTR